MGFSVIVSCETTSESDIYIHAREKKIIIIIMLENAAAFKSTLVLQSKFKRLELSPAVELSGGFHAVR